MVVVIVDIMICIGFLLFICLLERMTRIEDEEIKQGSYHANEFTVKIKGLPRAHEYKTLNQLKALLSLHLSSVISREDPVLSRYDKNDAKIKSNSLDIVNVYFAKRNFECYEVLGDLNKKVVRVLQLQKQLAEVEQLNLNDPENRKKSLEIRKMITDEKKEVNQLKDKYLSLDLEGSKDQIRNAFVTFRSMDGALRL